MSQWPSIAGLKANRYIRRNRDGAIQVLIEWAKASREDAAASYDSSVRAFSEDGNMSDDDLRILIDNASKEIKATRPFSPPTSPIRLRYAKRRRNFHSLNRTVDELK